MKRHARIALFCSAPIVAALAGCQTASTVESGGASSRIAANRSVFAMTDAARAACLRLGVAVNTHACDGKAGLVEGRSSRNEPVRIEITPAPAGGSQATVTVAELPDGTLARRIAEHIGH